MVDPEMGREEFELWIKNDKVKNIKNIRLYITILKDLQAFHPKPLNYIDLDIAFFNGFKNFYLDKTPPIQTSTIIKRMRSFKVFLNEKYKQGEIEDPRLDDARDLYLIGCSTGLRYSDVIKLSFDRIKGGFIETDILKTGRTLTIPLNPLSEKFIFKQFSKYDNKVREISNQKLNKALTDLFEYLAEKHPEKPFSSKEMVRTH